jgi:hypothetical protein
MFDLLNPVSSRKALSPVTHTHSDTYGGSSTDIVSRINGLSDEDEQSQYLTLLVMSGAISINSQLRNALKSIGLQGEAILQGGQNRHLILGASKLSSGMIEYFDNDACTYYAKGYGYVAPIKTSVWNYIDIENVNASTPWVATVKKYKANCEESTENRNMALEAKGKQYDSYIGLSTHKYLYATKHNVSMELEGINPKTQSKDFYYYTVEGEGSSYYNDFTHWWDKMPPKNDPTDSIVEREYIGRIEPTDADKRVGYKFREWLDDGTNREVTDYYDFYAKWFEITDSSTLSIPVTDVKGELIDQYTISGTEKYQWYDGTILSIPRTNTFSLLKTSFGLTIAIEVTYSSATGGVYKIHRKITFTGSKVNSGSSNSFNKTWETTATYTTSPGSSSGASSSTSTGTRAIKWG